MTTPEPITAKALKDFLWSQGVQDCVCLDELYALPSYEWLWGVGADLIFWEVRDRVGNYTKACADCDDFARCAAEYMRFIHRWTKAKVPGTAVAFGVWIYTRRDGQAHAINAFIYRVDGKLQLGFIEPQTGQFLELNQQEIQSCKLPEF